MSELGKLVLQFADKNYRTKVGDGECWTLAERALESAGAKTSNDLQDVNKTVNYVWGTEVPIGTALPGDIVQFQDGFKVETKVTHADGSWESRIDIIGLHHTAIVKTIKITGKRMQLIGQNLPPRSGVNTKDFFFKSYTFEEGADKFEVTVNGVVKFYRPIAKPAAKRK